LTKIAIIVCGIDVQFRTKAVFKRAVSAQRPDIQRIAQPARLRNWNVNDLTIQRAISSGSTIDSPVQTQMLRLKQ
jgi:hypothetical protein